MTSTGIVRGCALLAALTAVAFSVTPAGAAPAPSDPGVLSKAAVDSAGNQVSSVAPGDTVNWVVTLPQNSAAQSTLALTDTIQAPQTYVPNSLVVPGKSQNTQLTGAVSPGGVVSVDGTINPTNTAAVANVPPPALTFATPSTGGDGYTPILFGANTYNLYHHFTGGNFINCFPKAAPPVTVPPTPVVPCAGYPTYLSTTNMAGKAPFGSGTNDFVSARQNNGYLDRATGRYYVAGAQTGTDDIGFLCIDFVNRTGCGWTAVGPALGFDGSGTGAYPFVQNGAFANGKYYALNGNGQILCVVTATMTPCASTPTAGVFTAGLPANQAKSGTFPSWGSTIHLNGNQIIVTMPTSYPAHTVQVSCWNPATDTKCSATYPRAVPGSNGTNNASGSLPTLDAAGAVTGYCINLNNADTDAGTTIAWDCFDNTGVVAPTPTNFAKLTFGYSKQGLAEFTTYKTRVYYPSQQRSQPDAYECYDFATNDVCTGTFPVRPTGVPGAAGVDGALVGYALVSDPDVPTCIWELGDFGQYFQFNALTGGRCTDTGTTATVNVAPNFCAPSAGPISYGAATVSNLTPAQAGATSTITVLAADGVTPIPGFNALPYATSVDLSKITYPRYQGLDTSKIFVRLSLISPDLAAWRTTTPAVSVSFKGPGLQACFKTTIPTGCAVAGTTITNTAEATLDGKVVPAITARLAVVAKPGTCTVHAAVQKVTDPPGQEAGWTFALRGPGLPPDGIPVVTTGTGAITFASNGAPVNLTQAGAYSITETVRSGWKLSTVASGNSRPVGSDVTDNRCTFNVVLPADQDANAVYQCTFTNTKLPPPTTPPTTPPTAPPTSPHLPNTGAGPTGAELGIGAALVGLGMLALVGATLLRRRPRHA